MPADVHMLNAPPPDIPRPFPASTAVSSAAPTRHSSLAALMNPEPVPVIDVSDDEESEAEAEMAAAVDDCDDDVEDEDEGSEEEEEEEEEEDSGKESILIAETHGPSATSEPTAAVAAILHPASFLPPADAAVPGGPALIPAVSASAPPVKPASTAKPRSKKPRSPSPSPPPLQPPLPLTTIRLQIRLGGPDNYQVDVSKMAKDTGQRPPTPPPRVKHPISESEQEPETDGGKKKKRRKNPASDYYDVNDPFIDDSELAIDERTFFAQTKQQGFYVSSGEIALLKDKTPKKPRLKKMVSLATAINASAAQPNSTHEVPTIAVPGLAGTGSEENASFTKHEESDEHVGQKRKRYVTVVENGKKRKIVDQTSFHPDLQASIEKLKEAVKAENWSQKGKFPPSLKPQIASLALQAIKLDEYDEHFFSLMPVLFPYNKFTMTKLIKRTVFPEHTKLLQTRQDELLNLLKALTEEGKEKAEEEWEKVVSAWDRRQEKVKQDHGTDSNTPTRHPTEEMEIEGHLLIQGEGDPSTVSSAPGGKESKEIQQPQKKYRLTEQMKSIVWQLVLLSNECCRLENEKNSLEGSVIQVSEQGSRKNLYQRIVLQFPEGWMNSGQISREVSAMKKKFEKETLEGED